MSRRCLYGLTLSFVFFAQIGLSKSYEGVLVNFESIIQEDTIASGKFPYSVHIYKKNDTIPEAVLDVTRFFGISNDHLTKNSNDRLVATRVAFKVENAQPEALFKTLNGNKKLVEKISRSMSVKVKKGEIVQASKKFASVVPMVNKIKFSKGIQITDITDNVDARNEHLDTIVDTNIQHGVPKKIVQFKAVKGEIRFYGEIVRRVDMLSLIYTIDDTHSLVVHYQFQVLAMPSIGGDHTDSIRAETDLDMSYLVQGMNSLL